MLQKGVVIDTYGICFIFR